MGWTRSLEFLWLFANEGSKMNPGNIRVGIVGVGFAASVYTNNAGWVTLAVMLMLFYCAITGEWE